MNAVKKFFLIVALGFLNLTLISVAPVLAFTCNPIHTMSVSYGPDVLNATFGTRFNATIDDPASNSNASYSFQWTYTDTGQTISEGNNKFNFFLPELDQKSNNITVTATGNGIILTAQATVEPQSSGNFSPSSCAASSSTNPNSPPNPQAPQNSSGSGSPTSTTPSSSTSSSDNLVNPIPYNSPQDLLIAIAKYLMGIIGIVAVVMIIYGGFRMVVSAGNTEQVEKARSTLTWAVAGFALALLAYSIIAIVQNALQTK